MKLTTPSSGRGRKRATPKSGEKQKRTPARKRAKKNTSEVRKFQNPNIYSQIATNRFCKSHVVQGLTMGQFLNRMIPASKLVARVSNPLYPR
jgi:hypothetical protein